MSRSPLPFEPATLVELLRWRAEHQPDELAYTFLLDGEEERAQISFAELDEKARGLAATLQELDGEGGRALMLYPPGIDYVVSFFGCLYARVIAVPAYPPRLGRPNPRIAAIVNDSTPAFLLAPDFIRAHQSSMISQNPELGSMRWIAPDADVEPAAAVSWREPGAGTDTLAFLQYTSGSTGDPNGVMVSHGNLLSNLATAQSAFHYTADTIGFSWLPPYHDMGLIGGVLHPMYGGFEIVLMSPISFLQRPARWLEAISRHRATVTGGPSSAYQLCVDRVTAEERSGLDLSCLEAAVNGAEPVRPEVIERFSEVFAECGFRKRAFYPCYGMAEATLLISGARSEPEPVAWTVSRKRLLEGHAESADAESPDGRVLVGSGLPTPGVEVVVADPETCERCPPGEVGELWVAGDGVAHGYWNRAEESERVFRARLATGEGPYLRTGDLGVIRDGTVFVTGRRSDVIIVRGRNYYPQDIEATVDGCHPALAPNRGAAFAIESGGDERLVIVHELPSEPNGLSLDAIAGAIRRAIAEEHELQVHAVALIRARSIPRTSSGKIQRRPCRHRFEEGTLDVVYEWRVAEEGAVATAPEPAAAGVTPPAGSLGRAAIERWLVGELAARLGVPADEVDVEQPFSFYGLDSIQAVTIAAELSRWLGRDVSATLAWDYPTIRAAASFLAEEDERRPATERAQRRRAEPAEAIAIVGMACRFPGGADTPEAFWELLSEGRDGVGEVPPERWSADDLLDGVPGMAGRHGGFIDGVDLFDAGLFGVSPREARFMDPQQRLLLEVGWEALERGGIAPDSLRGIRGGVFVGLSTSDYALLQAAQGASVDVYAGTGNAHSIAANRLSYLLGLEGPSMAVDTACSSSLVATHLACASLRSGECDIALAGGVNLLLSPEATVSFAKARMLSPTGRCRTFDDAADGYVRGEGCGVIVLKRLADAEAGGDRVLALIRGSAVNQDGRSNGLTAPHGPSQEEVIRRALEVAGVEAGEVDYVEAHGTGTPLGDPIELRALGRALGRGRQRPLLVGSVKTNIGHLEAAAGIAGLIKAALAVGHGEVPPHLHFSERNANVAWEDWPLEVPTEGAPLGNGRRVAGVSSFGFGGTNAHLVLEGASPAPDETTEQVGRPELVKLAARGEPALAQTAARLREFIDRNPDARLPAIAHAAGSGRADLPDRAAIVAETVEELVAGLESVAAGDATRLAARGRVPAGGAPKVAFLVPGQGSRYGGALAGLYARDPSVRARVDSLAEVLGPVDELPLAALLEGGEGADRALTRTDVAQPALYALALALAAWWQSAGVQPAAVVGHSVGAYAAAALAGIVSMEDGARLVAARGHMMAELASGGAMAAVTADRRTVAAALSNFPELTVACVNAPDETVVAGPAGELERLCSKLGEAGLRARLLEVSHAFHSPLVEPCLGRLAEELRATKMGAAALPFVSDTTGSLAGREVATADYWVRHARQPVDFAAALDSIATLGCRQLVELGPGSTLLGLARRHPAMSAATLLPTLSHSDTAQPVHALARAWAGGAALEWARVAPPSRCRIELPTYPFQRERHWIPDRPRRSRTSVGLRPEPVPTPLPQSIYETHLSVDGIPFLGDHRVAGRPLVPAVAFVELLLAAADAAGIAHPAARDVVLLAPLLLPEDAERRVQVVIDEPSGGRRTARVFSEPDGVGAWVLHVQASVEPRAALGPLPVAGEENGHYPFEMSPDGWYRGIAERGLEFGPAFQTIAGLRRGDSQAVAMLVSGAAAAPAAGGGRVHPLLVDAGLQTLGALLTESAPGGHVYVPVALGSVHLRDDGQQPVRCRAVLREAPAPGGPASGDVLLIDAEGGVVGAIEGVRLTPVAPVALAAAAADSDVDGWIYGVEWRERPLASPARPAEPGRWLVTGGDDGLGAELVRRLEAAGADVVEHHVVPAVEEGDRFRGIVHVAHPAASADGAAEHALGAIQGLARSGLQPSPRLYLVTRGAQAAGAGVIDPAQASLWGLGRVARNEHPAFGCTLVDVDPGGVAGESSVAGALAAELLAGDGETEVALRGGRRFVSRLARTALEPLLAETGAPGPEESSVSLVCARKGVLEDLALQPLSLPAAGPGQVKIRVRAAGLNFRDVLNALGLYPGDAGPLGGECAGEVVEVGAGVEGVSVGDEVVAIAPASFATHALTDARLTAPKPRGIGFEEAAGVPIAFLTAWYGLERLSRLAPGARVLVHAATGGVGMAALQLCRRAGAEVFATAGSPRKRARLEALGVEHVMDSRSTSFADETLAATDGEGVDIVLNSLTGDLLERSLSVLRPGGSFVEIGKAEILDAGRLTALEAPIEYHAFDLAELCAAEPELVRGALRDVCSQIETGELEPLPVRVFDLDQAALAFRHMAQAKHIGKVVLAARKPQPDSQSQQSLPFDPDATYLVTGGLGALGRLVARAMLDNGARNLVLTGRHAGAADESPLGDDLPEGATVLVRACDVADAVELAALLETVDASMPQLRGIVHAAGVLDDGVIAAQTADRFEKVMAPKARGAWNLHMLSAGRELDFFVLFSSAAALLGSPGQASYAAANAFLGGLAHHRQSQGLPATAIDWGPWAGTGMAASVDGTRRRTARGIGTVGAGQGIDLFVRALRTGPAEVAVMPIDWRALAEALPAGAAPPLLEDFLGTPKARAEDSGTAARDALVADLRSAAPDARLALLVERITAQAAIALGLDPAAGVESDRPLAELGLDSLSGVELSNMVGRMVGMELPATLLFDQPTVDALAGHILEELLPDERENDALADGGDRERARAVSAIEGLSDEEAEALLDRSVAALMAEDEPPP